MPKNIEALADALFHINDGLNPDSTSYQLRNPGLLKAFSLHLDQAADSDGTRIFTSFIGGYRALVQDLETKCSGISRSKLSPDSPLHKLLSVYGHSLDSTIYAVDFLQHALNTKSITENTPIKFFLE